MKPIIKWVGGKRQILLTIKENLPSEFGSYFEPFVGGGALFFNLGLRNSVIGDNNFELINMYLVVKNNLDLLLEDLKKHKNNEEYFYSIRNLDRDKNAYNKLSSVEKASRFIFLNKTCFNGLYRVNSKNEFNTPFGKHDNPTYVDLANIRLASNLLNDTTILHADFEGIKGLVKPRDLVYLDPPYVPLSKTSCFTNYTAFGFDELMHIRLKNFCDYIDKLGAYFILSNSNTSFVEDIFRGYKFIQVKSNRFINANPNKRGKIKEYLIKNF